MGGLLLDRIEATRTMVADLRDRLRPLRFVRRLDDKKQATADAADRLERAFRTLIGRDRLLLAETKTALEGRNPLAVLARGFCVAEKDGRLVRSVGSLARNDRLRIRFYDGKSHVIVERVEHDRNV
jgi:exodeoxyribonuclease VII large subunit